MSEDVTVDLSTYRQGDYDPGPIGKRVLWYLVSLLFVDSPLPWPQAAKRGILRLFGAGIGEGVVIKPRLRIKFPWKLKVGDHAWLGEGVWIDNVAPVKIGGHACLSQEVGLFTGNHDRTLASFDLREGPITIGEGAWLGARSVVCPGATVGSHAVLNAGAVGKGELKGFGVYEGNPAQWVGERTLSTEAKREGSAS